MMSIFAETIDRFFKISRRGSSIRSECLAGLTIFVTMCYIIFINTSILSAAGMPAPGAMAATIFAAALATMIMGLWVNAPVALAPGMGINAYFTYTLCGDLGFTWQQALGVTFISGGLFFAIMISGLGAKLIAGLPRFSRHAITVGVGFFIVTVGMKNAGIVVGHPATLVAPGNVSDPKTLLSLLGLAVMAVMLARRVRGAILWGVLLVTALGMSLQVVPAPQSWADLISFDLSGISGAMLQMRFDGLWKLSLVPVVMSFSLTMLFNNIGTLIGLASRTGNTWTPEDERSLHKELTASAGSMMAACALGTSGVTTYIESAAGLTEGGRTGLAAVVVSALFLLALFLHPLLRLIPAIATAPGVIIAGIMMMQEARNIHFDDFEEAFPACITIAFMAISFSIYAGLCFGYISYIAIKAAVGKPEEITMPTLLLFLVICLSLALS